MAILGVASATLAASQSFAVPITYTEEATASGSLGGVAFNNETIVVRMVNDTSNVTNGGNENIFCNNAKIFCNFGTTTIQVGGGAPVTFVHPTVIISEIAAV